MVIESRAQRSRELDVLGIDRCRAFENSKAHRSIAPRCSKCRQKALKTDSEHSADACPLTAMLRFSNSVLADVSLRGSCVAQIRHDHGSLLKRRNTAAC